MTTDMTIDAIKQMLGTPNRSLYQPIELPEFEDWPVQQPCVERWAMIEPHLPPAGTALDLGSNTGWFCRRFSRAGWRAIGIERSPEWSSVAVALNDLCEVGHPPEYRFGDLMSMTLPEADVVLALSVLMYLFDHEQDGLALLNWMSQSAPVAFVDFGGMYAERLPFDAESFPSVVRENTGYTAVELLGHTDLQSRPLYKLSR